MNKRLDDYNDRENMFSADTGDEYYDVQSQACKNLWSAVVHTAIADLVRGTSDPNKDRYDLVYNYWKAYLWLTEKNVGRVTFEAACDLAGIDPVGVKEKIDKEGLLERGRNPPIIRLR